jgi:mRNA-degrading endonuclease RelE of RelBE toxin-antitoxin system
MPNEPSPIEIDLSPRFTRDLRDLAKHYRKIRSDLKPLTDQLLQGETPGDRIQGVKSIVFKVRLTLNSSRNFGRAWMSISPTVRVTTSKFDTAIRQLAKISTELNDARSHTAPIPPDYSHRSSATDY